MTKFDPGDNPDYDNELRYGDPVYLMTDDVLNDTEYTIVRIGTSTHDFDYVVKAPDGRQYKVSVSDVVENNAKTLLILTHGLDADTTELPALDRTEEYELLGTTPSRAGQYAVINAVSPRGETYTKKVPIVLWGHYIIKQYVGDILMPLDSRTVIRPMIALPRTLEPQRVTSEMFVDYYIIE